MYKKLKLPLFCTTYHLFIGSKRSALDSAISEVFPEVVLQFMGPDKDTSGFTFSFDNLEKGFTSLIAIKVSDNLDTLETAKVIAEQATLLSWDIAEVVGLDVSSENAIIQSSIIKELVGEISYAVEQYLEVKHGLDDL